VKVSVNVPCAAAFAATTEIVDVKVPPTVIELGLIEQVVCGCGSKQLRFTVPANPPSEFRVSV
jgi:hypothetical protein